MKKSEMIKLLDGFIDEYIARKSDFPDATRILEFLEFNDMQPPHYFNEDTGYCVDQWEPEDGR